MEIIPLLLKEMEQEVAITRKFFARLPGDKMTWKPHDKSTDMAGLANHIAELPGWIKMALSTEGLDFAAGDYKPNTFWSSQELIKQLEDATAESKKALMDATEADLLPIWTMRMGDQVLARWTKYEVIRHALAQMIHHRAQLGVYFRLLNIPLPSSYGPSADEQSF